MDRQELWNVSANGEPCGQYKTRDEALVRAREVGAEIGEQKPDTVRTVDICRDTGPRLPGEAAHLPEVVCRWDPESGLTEYGVSPGS